MLGQKTTVFTRTSRKISDEEFGLEMEGARCEAGCHKEVSGTVFEVSGDISNVLQATETSAAFKNET